MSDPAGGSGLERRTRARRYGLRAETLGALWLRLKGYRVLARNFRIPVGEIDIVARRGAILAFVEVKARAEIEDAAAALGRAQRRRIQRAAEAFVQRHRALGTLSLRFDVLLVRPWRPPLHIADAWRPD